MGRYHYVFPKWSNLLLPLVLLVGAVTPLYVALMVAYGFSPVTTDVGYQPEQPIPFSHAIHAGDLGIDCRYCHNTVERASFAAIPPTKTCMNCHSKVHKDSPKLEPLRVSFQTGEPIPWIKVHDLPDYAFFDHSAHVTRGVSCVECHGRIDRMEIVRQDQELSMGWCLECHRNPDPHLRDPALVTNLGWSLQTDDGGDSGERAQQLKAYGEYWKNFNQINPSQDCSTCHR